MTLDEPQPTLELQFGHYTDGYMARYFRDGRQVAIPRRYAAEVWTATVDLAAACAAVEEFDWREGA